MKHLHILPFLLLLFTLPCFGQAEEQWAGPDTVSCGDKGVVIGSTASCPGCCFEWSPKEGLDDAHIQNPTATPKKETTYTVIVTDENLSWKKTDDVVVGLSFGELHFIPDHLEQGTDEIVLAKLMNNDENFPTTWTFSGDDLGCTLEPSMLDEDRATLTPGVEYGKLLVKVINQNDTACSFTDTLPVNSGVKDLKVVDMDNPNRFAETGETLYLVSSDYEDMNARLYAIPNEGGFAEGIPDYKQDSHMTPVPEDGNPDQVVIDVPTIEGKISEYIAGDEQGDLPYVTVVRKLPVQSPIDVVAFLQNLDNLWAHIDSLTNFSDVDFNAPGSPPAPDGPCPETTAFNFDAVFALPANEVEVEKYGDPGIGLKKTYSISAAIDIGGKLYHPQFTRHFIVLGAGICSELYAGISLNTTAQMSISSDESLMDSGWKLDDPNISVTLSGTVGFSAALVSGTGYNLQASGSATIGAKIVIELALATEQVLGYGQFNPATIKLEAKIVNENNLGEYDTLFNLLSSEIVLYSKTDEPEKIVLYDLN